MASSPKQDSKGKKKFILSPNVIFHNVLVGIDTIGNKVTGVAQSAASVVTGPGFVTNKVEGETGGGGALKRDVSPHRRGGAGGGGATVKQRRIIKDGVMHLRNIFAVPIPSFGATGAAEEKKDSKYKHSAVESKFLKAHLKDHYLFESLPANEMERLVSAFELHEIPSSESEDVVIIQQGDWVQDDTAYFYLLFEGRCYYELNGEIVGERALPGDCFGELALLYNCPRAATVKAMTSIGTVKLFRIHQRAFRRVLRQENESPDGSKLQLLSQITFLRDNLRASQMATLASAMKPKLFENGDIIVSRGSTVTEWTVIDHGTVRVMNIATGKGNVSGATGDYQDVILGHGECFGERLLKQEIPTTYDIVAETSGLAFTIEKSVFFSVLGDKLSNVVQYLVDAKKLKGVKVIIDTIPGNSTRILNYLAAQINDETYPKGSEICHEGLPISAPAFYFVRKGKVRITSNRLNRDDIIEQEYYFGDDQLLFDTRPSMVSSYTATVMEEGTVLGILTLESCRKIISTKTMGQPDKNATWKFDSLTISSGGNGGLSLDQFNRITVLGAGTFGQVWLVTRKGSDSVQHSYALKVQSKFELVESGQAAGVVHEKQIMKQLQHPFINQLIASFQDKKLIYMVLPLIQGGELYTVMHMKKDKTMSETNAIFYLTAITEGLTYMHRRGFVYRDLKPENVLIDEHGYPIIIDFGFAKYVLDRTFTLCGTPLYIAPEVILNRGHNWGADHWSLGCLAYEMLAGRTPFFEKGMDQSDLFRAIVKGTFSMSLFRTPITSEAESFITGLLTRNPSKRLGNARLDDILFHPWLNTINHDSLLLKELKAPYIPNIADPTDGSNFSDWSNIEDKTKKNYPTLQSSQEKIFEGF